MIRAGLFLYDHLARRELLPGSRGIDMRRHPAGAPLVDSIRRGFVYSDGWVDDARLVVLNALDAHEHGATILTRTRARQRRARRRRMARDAQARGRRRPSTCAPRRSRTRRARGSANCCKARSAARARVTACGSSRAATSSRGACSSTTTRTSSRIPTSGSSSRSRTKRDYTLIGTTDIEYRRRRRRRSRSAPTKSQYLCDSINRYFKQHIAPADVCWTYSGVRPLLEDEDADNASAVTRDYLLELDAPAGDAPLLSVFGGKITTFRKLAEEAVDKLARRAAVARRARGPKARRCPAAIFADAELRALSRRIQAAASVASRRSRASLCARLRHARRAGDRRGALASQNSAKHSRRASTKPNCATCATPNGRRAPRTCCGAARSSACTSAARRSTT